MIRQRGPLHDARVPIDVWETAKEAASAAGRSTAAQVAWWVRLGRYLEMFQPGLVRELGFDPEEWPDRSSGWADTGNRCR